jgi:hypothetical protein
LGFRNLQEKFEKVVFWKEFVFKLTFAIFANYCATSFLSQKDGEIIAASAPFFYF